MRFITGLLLLAAAVTLNGAPAGDPPATQPDKGATMTIQSTAFRDGEVIPKKHTGEGTNVSPALTWSGLPAGTRELALVCDDPDAPRAEPWVHWVIYNIPADARELPEGMPTIEKPDKPAGAVQGISSAGKTGYHGPMPPRGHGVHHYRFRLYALGAPLGLAPGLDKDALLKAIKEHTLASCVVVGTYERPAAGR